MTHLEQAIRDAIEKGGYNPKPNYYSPFNISNHGVMFHGDDHDHEFYPVDTLLMSPAFWQALGKARGWKNNQEVEHYEAGSVLGGYRFLPSLYYRHRLVDHLDAGKDVESFFETL